MATTLDDKLPAFQKYLLEKNLAEAKNWRNIDKEGQTINADPSRPEAGITSTGLRANRRRPAGNDGGAPLGYFFPLAAAFFCSLALSFRLLSRLLLLRSSSFVRSTFLCLLINLLNPLSGADDVDGMDRGRLQRGVDPRQNAGSGGCGEGGQEPRDGNGHRIP